AHRDRSGRRDPPGPVHRAPAGSGARDVTDQGDGAGPEAEETQKEMLHGCPVDSRRGVVVVHCNRDQYLDLCTALKADGYAMPIGVTGVDYLTHPGRDLPEEIEPKRFEVVVELLSLAEHKRVRVRCQVPEEDPRVPSLFDLWRGTEAHERETYDMFGITFD